MYGVICGGLWCGGVPVPVRGQGLMRCHQARNVVDRIIRKRFSMYVDGWVLVVGGWWLVVGG